MRSVALAVVLVLALTACSRDDDPGARTPTATADASATPPADAAEPTPSETGPPPHPVSLDALAAQRYDGRGLELGEVVLRTATQTQYDVTYRGGGLTLSGRLAVPTGEGPFPAIVLAHGYIDPAIYTVGRGMTRERAWFADRGFVTLHVDYRNHGDSDTDPRNDVELRLGYTEDVINAVRALRRWDGPVDDERVAVGGRSMGGGVVYNVLAVRPGLVDAGVVWAPVSSDARDNFERWIRDDPGRSRLADAIIRRHGDPAEAAHAEFWNGVSPRSRFDAITEPVLIHHGTSDDVCPPRWSRATTRALRAAGVDVTLELYEGEEHAFGPQFTASMQSATRFLRRHLR